MKEGTPEHPKTLALADRLQIHILEAIGLLEALFHCTAKYAPQGDIGKHSNKLIAHRLHWEHDAISPDELIEALVETGWLEWSEAYRIVVHDWSDHAEQGAHFAVARARTWFVDGRKPVPRNMSNRDGSRDQAYEFYRKHPSPPPDFPIHTRRGRRHVPRRDQRHATSGDTSDDTAPDAALTYVCDADSSPLLSSPLHAKEERKGGGLTDCALNLGDPRSSDPEPFPQDDDPRWTADEDPGEPSQDPPPSFSSSQTQVEIPPEPEAPETRPNDGPDPASTEPADAAPPIQVSDETVDLVGQWKGSPLHHSEISMLTRFAESLDGRLVIADHPVDPALFAERCVKSAIEADAGFANMPRAMAYLSKIASDCIDEGRMPGTRHEIHDAQVESVIRQANALNAKRNKENPE